MPPVHHEPPARSAKTDCLSEISWVHRPESLDEDRYRWMNYRAGNSWSAFCVREACQTVTSTRPRTSTLGALSL